MFEWILGDWRSLGFVALSTVLVYGSAVLALRLGERRTLAEMSSFDLVVIVAVGSIVGRTATTPRPSYAQAMVGLAALLLLHHVVSWVRLRSVTARRCVDRRPVVLVDHGELRSEALARVHLSEADVWRVLRRHHIREVASVDLLVMESSGQFSVFDRSDRPIDPRLLADLGQSDARWSNPGGHRETS